GMCGETHLAIIAVKDAAFIKKTRIHAGLSLTILGVVQIAVVVEVGARVKGGDDARGRSARVDIIAAQNGLCHRSGSCRGSGEPHVIESRRTVDGSGLPIRRRIKENLAGSR